MKIKIEDFSPEKIAKSGQCFRLKVENNSISLIYKDKWLKIDSLGDSYFEFSCDEKEYNNIWKSYFDIDTNYNDLMKDVITVDSYAASAFEYGKGMKLLRQEPFEMTISFIISQRKNIAAISSSIEALCTRYGKPIGENRYSFPTPEVLADLSIEELNACSLGYRSKYVKTVAKDVKDGLLNLDEIASLNDDALIKRLCEEYGIGIKVASCIALFGYHRLSVCPIDVWMKKIIDRVYNGSSPFEDGVYKKYAGVIQQYMFFYERSL